MSQLPTDLSQTIAQTASEPARTVMDGQDVTAQGLDKLIMADDYLARKKASAKPFSAMRDRRGVPGGMIGRSRR